MGKRIEIDGAYYRKREGEWVLIPSEWVGRTTDQQTKKKRRSKWTPKQREATPKIPFSKGRVEYFESRNLRVPNKGSYIDTKYRRRKDKFAEEELKEYSF